MKNISLSRHRQTHTERCELCNALFYKRIALITLFPDEQLHTCKHCDEKFKSQQALDKHSQTHYARQLNQCEICNLSFKTKRLLTKHVESEHPASVPMSKRTQKTYECSVCHRVFLKKKERKKHLQVHLEAGLKIHACKVCSKSYTTEKALRMHMIKHASDDNKPRCKVCNKMFSHPFSLRYHMRIHSNSKPCVCSVCNQAFRQAGHLKRHLLTHDTASKVKRERRYRCDVCTRHYATSHDLSLHMMTHDGEKKFSCEHCGKAFLFKRTLTHHLNTHTGDKPYTCDVCEKAFAQPGSLHKHKQTHVATKVNNNKDESRIVLPSKISKNADRCTVTATATRLNGVSVANSNGIVHIAHPSLAPSQPQILLTNQLQPIHNTPPPLEQLQQQLVQTRGVDSQMQSRAPEYRSDCLEPFPMQHVHLQFPSPFKAKAASSELPVPNQYWHLQQPNIVYQHQPNPQNNLQMFLQSNNQQLQ